MTGLEIPAYIEAVEAAGVRLREAAGMAGVDAAVPTCPEWVVRDLVRHIGGVHTWATTILREHRVEEYDGELEELAGGWPPDEDLLAWFAQRHAALVDSLRSADPSFPYWIWRTAPSSLWFWAARMAHETTVHLFDADAAAARTTPLDLALAVDGVDDLVCRVVAGRAAPPKVPAPTSLGLRATDADRTWRIQLSPDRFDMSGDIRGDEDCLVTAPAADLYRLVWHRASEADVDVVGDVAALHVWWRNVDVQWE